ncbi:MAG: hypothetical protein LH480_13035 [Rubrivivax sp.]|nr:hypothetical protein [Rubrivivax sp.]
MDPGRTFSSGVYRAHEDAQTNAAFGAQWFSRWVVAEHGPGWRLAGTPPRLISINPRGGAQLAAALVRLHFDRIFLMNSNHATRRLSLGLSVTVLALAGLTACDRRESQVPTPSPSGTPSPSSTPSTTPSTGTNSTGSSGMGTGSTGTGSGSTGAGSTGMGSGGTGTGTGTGSDSAAGSSTRPMSPASAASR